MKNCLLVLAGCVVLLLPFRASSADGSSGALHISVSNSVKTISWPRPVIPALETNRLQVGGVPTVLFDVSRAAIATTTNGYSWRVTNSLVNQFYALTVAQMSSNQLLTANALNRLAYGPTPDELQRVATIGPQAFIDEQLQPETITAPLPDAYRLETVNAAITPPSDGWASVTVTGNVSSAIFYIYLTGPGNAYMDDVSLSVIYTNVTYTTNVTATNTIITTNFSTYLGTNVLVNGNFEQPFKPAWTNVGTYYNASAIAASPVHSGAGSLHVVSVAPIGSDPGNGNAVTQFGISGLSNVVNSSRCVLSFSYLVRPNSGDARLILRLSGGGVTASDGEPAPLPQWAYGVATGTATATPTLYLYLDGAGDTYLDDLQLVAGRVAETGPNLVRNGNFDTTLSPDWSVTTNFTNSVISPFRSHSGPGSLHLIGTAAGSGNGNAFFQTNIAGLTAGQTYTVSFWYTVPTRGRRLTVRLSGSALQAVVPDVSTISGIKRRFDTIGTPSPDDGSVTIGSFGGGFLADLRAWFIMNAVASPRQLLEVLTQFFENHFVTEHSKSFDYFDRYYDGDILDTLAADWEYREVSGWRQALLSPNCTFYDLLKISAESPAEIVYLDTVESRGDATRVANENYARELFELYCMGVDNGYDQLDITAMSRAWTGWSVDIVDRNRVHDPLAPQSRTYGFYPNNSTRGVSNLVGVWTFNFKPAWHGTNRGAILSEWSPAATRTNLIRVGPKRYPARLGAPWAGRAYDIPLPRRVTGDPNGIQDGYDVVRSLSTNLFTAEYISVKLCRLFVHDAFPNPTTTTSLPEYAFYDYTNPNRSAEADLIHGCMVAWDTPGPDGRKGNIRSVLRTIFDSDLFRSHGGSMQKVKTPLEFSVSTIRALRAGTANGGFTASTDGYSISGRRGAGGNAPLLRMGNMRLFDRDAPDGYPEAGPPWISAGTLAERIRFVQTALMNTSDTNKNDAISGGNSNLTDPVGLLKARLPAASWVKAADVADLFLALLFPGEGKANLDLYQLNAVAFLDSSDDGTQSSPFSLLDPAGAPYDTRVRAMVAMLMTLQRFQEQ